MAEKDNIIEVTESQITVATNVTPNTTEIQESTEDVVVQVSTPLTTQIKDTEIIDINIEEAFPFSLSGILNNTMGDNDVLIDGGSISSAVNQPSIPLEEVINAAAAEGGSGTSDHRQLGNKEANDQHPISAISGLSNKLADIESVKRMQSSENGLSEFRKWHDGNPAMEDRAGYFVKLVPGTEDIAICNDEDDVYGITVVHSGFVGNQNNDDKSKDPSYAMVGIAGALRVRTDGTARNGEYVVPNALGEATFSENSCGYKVISQGSYASYQYVTIAVTPQNDKISKIYGMLSSTENGSTLGNIIIQIQDIKDQVNENSQKVDIVVADNESIKDIIEENQENIIKAVDTSAIAYEAAQNAKEQVSTVVESANEAVRIAQDAAAEAQLAADDLVNTAEMVNQMEPIVNFESGEYQGAAGIIKMATENQMNLGTLMNRVDDQGSDLAALMLKSDGNGMAIQSLVSHVDKYTVGEYSTTYGLSQSNAKSILVGQYIYVPTEEHSEYMLQDDGTKTWNIFKRGYSYIWDSESGRWAQSSTVSIATEYQAGENEGDLWLCWQDVEQRNEKNELVATYISGTLYRWFDTVWIAVASVADNAQSRMLTTSTQTADEISQSVLNSQGEGSTVKQKMDSIFTTVYNNDGYISAIEQTAQSIRAGTYTDDGNASQLELLVSDTESSLSAAVSGRFHVLYQSYIGIPPDVYDNGNKYSKIPLWDDATGEFVFNDTYVDENGEYYFDSADKTKYCKVVDGGYEIYTIGNKATSALNQRVSNNESDISLLSEFKTNTTEALATITSKTDSNEAAISSMAARYYHALISINEIRPQQFGEYRYAKEPTWNVETGRYEFNPDDRYDFGTYYMADENSQSYCKIVTTEDGTQLYEVYGLVSDSAASIVQRVDENRASIGLVVENNQVKGSVLIGAINGESTAQINADRIELSAINGTISSLTQHAQATDASLSAVTAGRFHVVYQSYLGDAPAANGNKYTTMPVWDEILGIFVFDENYADENGSYYFYSNDQTKYCKLIYNDDGTVNGYEIYTIGNKAVSSFDSRISTNEAILTGTAMMDTANSEALSNLTIAANRDGSTISSVASYYYHSLIKVTDEYMSPAAGETFQLAPPRWNVGENKYVFDDNDNSDDDGSMYCFVDEARQTYARAVKTEDGMLYELYGVGGSANAALVQEVSANRASIGMVVETEGDNKGKVTAASIVAAINNDESTATIQADKIDLNGYVTISSLGSSGTTTIDGSRITTGVIKSRDYQIDGANSTFSTYGTELNLIHGSITSRNFSIGHTGNVFLKHNINVGLNDDNGYNFTVDDSGNVFVRNNINIGLNSNGGYNFTVDSYGNVNVAGVIDATDLRINGQSVLTDADKIAADYLELKGLIIKDSNDNTTFAIDTNGNVTLNGSISWDDDSDIYSRLEAAEDAANEAKDTVGGWTYTDGTSIDGTMIATGTVTASYLYGGTVGLLSDKNDYYGNPLVAGSMYITSATTANHAVQLESKGALRLVADEGTLFLHTGKIDEYGSVIQYGSFVSVPSITDGYDIVIGNDYGNQGSFSPTEGGSYSLGYAYAKWTDVYCTNSTIQTSDIRQKKNIEYNVDLYDRFFFALKPTQYKFVDGQSNRYHIGFISQDVEQALEDNNLTSLDFAGFIKSPMYEEDEETIKEYSYGLRYGEFIALNTHMIQKLYKRVEELESKLEELSK